MNNAIQQIHNTTMDLADIARIKKVKEGEASFSNGKVILEDIRPAA